MAEFFNVLLKILLIALCGLCIFLAYKLCRFLFIFSQIAVPLLDMGIKKISYPFKVLTYPVKKVTQYIEDFLLIDPFPRLSRRHPVLGSARGMRFILLSIIAMVVLVIVYACNNNLAFLFTESSLFMLPFFFVVRLISREITFSVVGLISTGVSGMIIGLFFKLCLDGYEHDGSILHRIVSIVYYTITTFMASYLGFILSGVWDWFAKTGINFFNILKDMILGSDWSFLGVLKFLGCALVLSIIIYVGIILLSVALKEYVESFCYGFIGFVIVFLFELICNVVFQMDVWDGTLRLIIEYTVFFACILIPDYIRVSSGDYE